MKITADTPIEDIVDIIPDAVNYLYRRGIRCIRCGEPIWGTISEAVFEKNFTERDLTDILSELNSLPQKD